MRLRTPSPAMAVACLALALSLAGTGYAVTALPKNSVGGPQRKQNAVVSAKVNDGSLKAADFGTGQLPQGPAGPAGPQGAFICYQHPPGPVTRVGNGIINLQLPPNTKVPMGLSKVLQLSPSANPYLVGMCGTGGASWTNNDWGTTSALVFTQ